MTSVAAILAVAALVVAARWWLRRYDALGRARPFPYVSVGLLVVTAVAAAVPSYLRGREEGRLAGVAGQLVGARVHVHCQTAGEELVDAGAELGYVRWGGDGRPEHRTVIKREQCRALAHYLHSNKQHPSMDEVVAVHVLTHESMHMRGEKSESGAECEALAHDAQTAQLLGADAAAAARLAATYRRDVYPQMPDDYRSADCAATQ